MIQIIGRPSTIKPEEIINAVEGYKSVDGTPFRVVHLDWDPSINNYPGTISGGYQDTIIEKQPSGSYRIKHGSPGAGSAFWEQSVLTGRFYARLSMTEHNMRVMAADNAFGNAPWSIREVDIRSTVAKYSAEYVAAMKTEMVEYTENGDVVFDEETGEPKLISKYDLRILRMGEGKRRGERKIGIRRDVSKLGNASSIDVVYANAEKDRAIASMKAELDANAQELALLKQQMIESGKLVAPIKYPRDLLEDKNAMNLKEIRDIVVKEFKTLDANTAGQMSREQLIDKVIEAQDPERQKPLVDKVQ